MRVWRVLVAVLAGVSTVAPAGSEGAIAVSRVGEVRTAPAMGPEFRISGDAAADALFPAIAWNEADDEFLVVWADRRFSYTWNIYGRRVGIDGALRGEDLEIYYLSTNPTANGYPAVAWNAVANEYLVVWQINRGAWDWDVFGRRVGADGVPIGAEFQISEGAAGSDQSTPRVVWNGIANEFLVVWEDWRDATTRQADIYGRRVGADGSLIGSDFRISGNDAIGNELVPKVAWNRAANEYLVVWEDGRAKATRGTDVWGRRLGADGIPAGTDFRVSAGPAPADVFFPDVAWSGEANQYLVVWEDWRDAEARDGDIYGRRIDAGANPSGEDFLISAEGGLSEDMRPAVAWDATSSGFLVVWEDHKWETFSYGIDGRRIGADGVPLDSDFSVGDGDTSATACNEQAGGCLVTWIWSNAIHGRRIDSGLGAVLPNSAHSTGLLPPSEGMGTAEEAGHLAFPSLGDEVDSPVTPQMAGSPVEQITGSAITVDVGVVYTRAARARVGRAALEAWVTNGVMYTNEAFERSEVDVRLRLVFVEEIDYHAYPACFAPSVNYGSVLKPARDLRDALGADLLVLVGEPVATRATGQSIQVGLVRDVRGNLETLGFGYVFAHEWGHNFGAMHEDGYGECTPPGCGYDAPDSSFRDIMSYGRGCQSEGAINGCPMIPNFSNPDVTFSWLDPPVLQPYGYDWRWNLADSNTNLRKGPGAQPTGVEGQADNASVINENAPWVAAYRPTVVPDGPMCLGIPATWVGTDGDDVFSGTPERDVVVAGDGDDTIYGLGGSDVICAGAGDDLVHGGDDTDFVFGGPGNDTVYGAGGEDFLDGEAGRDTLYGELGNDVLVGGDGNDRLDGSSGDDYLYAGPGNDTLLGGDDTDWLLGREGDDRLDSGSGTELNDYVQPGPGTDVITGDASFTLSFEDSDGPVELDLSSLPPFTTTGANGAGVVHLDEASVFAVVGSRFSDRLMLRRNWMRGFGLFGDDYLSGGGWAALVGLFGDDGDDRLDGGLTGPVDGGRGTDSCRGSTVTNCEIALTDTTAPVVTVPAHMTVVATSGAGASVTFTVSADDYPDLDPTVTCVPLSGSLFPLGTTTVNCSATDASGNTGTGSFTITVVPAPLTATFLSVGGYDGWVLEKDESAGKGGTFDATSTTGRVGDDASDRQYRSILHFDTATLPNNAVITGITLRIKKQSMVGASPFDTHGFLTVDMRTGAFHDDPVLEKLDFQAAGSRGNVGRFVKTAALGWYRAPLRAVSYPLVNLTGSTQFRLRYTLDDNDDLGADYLAFYTGDAAVADRPELIVTYHVP